MALPIIADTFRVALEWNGGDAVNVIHVFSLTGDANDIADALEASVDSDMWATVSDSYEIDSIVVTALDGTSTSVVRAPTTAADWTGGTGGEYIPGYATVVSLRTNERGRSKRGRVFLPRLAESAVANGIITSVDLSAMQLAWDTFRTNLNGEGCELVVASYLLETSEPVTVSNVSTKPGVLHKRQRRAAAA